jgi:hypothetical protein
MPSPITFACLALLSFIAPTAAQAQARGTVLEGKTANEELGAFLSTRWHRQTWKLEFKPVDGLSSGSRWHVAGTPYWADLDGPDDLKHHFDLAKMDTQSTYQFTGIPVDLNYGTITFFVLRPPEKVVGKAPTNVSQENTVEVVAPPPANTIEELPGREALCLAEACRITALMNDGKWDEVEKAFGTKERMVGILKHHAALKDWPGIGAYRGVRIDRESPRELTFRFGFAPKSSPHEVQISFADGNPSKPGLMVLGW